MATSMATSIQSYPVPPVPFTIFHHSMFPQVFVHQFLLHSSCRTENPAEADFFYVPIYASCVMSKKNKYAPEPCFKVADLRILKNIG